jgi:hypothetical protein
MVVMSYSDSTFLRILFDCNHRTAIEGESNMNRSGIEEMAWLFSLVYKRDNCLEWVKMALKQK